MQILRLIRLLGLAIIGGLILFCAGVATWWYTGDWQKRATEDVAFVHETIMAHHPGPVDAENPAFSHAAEIAYKQAMASATNASTASDHRHTLNEYADAFADGHLGVFFPGDVLRFITPNQGSDGAIPKSASLETSDDMAWISIPSFSERGSAIADLTIEIENNAANLRASTSLIFDLRGNSGGDSSFGTRIVTALWSAEMYKDWVPVSAEAVDWRATPENAKHVRSIAKRHAKKGREDYAEYWSTVAEGITEQASRDRPYYRQSFSQRETSKTISSPVLGKVIVVTDKACASACLDFMDKLMALPDVLHVGEETSSDTQYIDVRTIVLPSRTGGLTFPLKVYRGRLRPPGGTYVPEVVIDPLEVNIEYVKSLVNDDLTP